mgnify:FL=1
MQSLVELTQKESENIVVNHNEDLEFAQKIDEFLNNNNCNTQPLRVGHTPFSLIICGANANLEVGISPETIIKCMSNSDDHYHGHELTKELIASLPQSIRDPIMIFKGSHNNSLLLVTELKDKYNKEIVVPIELSSRKARTFINRITSAYGKKNIENYIFNQLQQQNLLAINKEKANKLIQSLGLRLPPEESFICYDNSIAYSMKNVKYPIEKEEEITLNEQEMMAQIEAKLRREFEAKFQKMEQKFASLEDQVQTINKFMAAMTEAQDLSKTMAEIESVTKQITECDKAAFYCYDRFTDKFFAQGNDYREWQEGQSAETLKAAFDDKRIMSEGDKTIIPIVSSDGGALGVITAEKENGLSEKEIEFFKPNSQIVNTIELALKKEFEHQGRITDELTHLKNRQGLNEYAADTICGRINDNLPVNIVMCDIDHFKSVNDTYGHDAGDTVLRDVAAILQEGTRTGSDCAFRFGGEEMILILNCEPEKAYEIAERLRISVENSEHTVTAADGQEKNISVTISMGVYQMAPEIEMTPDNARAVFDAEFKCADELVYNAKETGRNKVVTTADIMDKVIAQREKSAEQGEKSVHTPHKDYKIFGTISYKDIVDKKRINGITAEHIDSLTDSLKKSGIDFSGIKDETTGKYSVSVDGWDNLKAARNIYNSIKSQSTAKEALTSNIEYQLNLRKDFGYLTQNQYDTLMSAKNDIRDTYISKFGEEFDSTKLDKVISEIVSECCPLAKEVSEKLQSLSETEKDEILKAHADFEATADEFDEEELLSYSLSQAITDERKSTKEFCAELKEINNWATKVEQTAAERSRNDNEHEQSK